MNRFLLLFFGSLALLFTLAITHLLWIDETFLSAQEIQNFFSKLLGFSDDAFTWKETVLWEIRLPRVLLAVGVGASLAIAGSLMQVLFSNPLAEPYITGVSSGAVFIVVLSIFLGLESQALLSSLGFVGACLAQGLILFLCRGHDKETHRLLLMGIGVSALLQAASMFFLLQAELPQMRSVLFWLMGSFAYKSWGHTITILCAAFVTGAISLALARPLDQLSLGEHKAFHLGLPVPRVRKIIFILSSTLVGLVVATCGMIGFVGLVAPHLARSITGIDHQKLLWLASVWGALFTLTADVLLHAFFPAQEIPVGIMTSFLGSIFLIYLLQKRRSVFF